MTTEQIIKSLNAEQKRAVLHKDGPVLIVAGAGSGKTRVLTSRIAMLLNDGVDASSILSLTFTKKAANEMRSRIWSMVGDSARGLVMGTFHSVFIRFLREFHNAIGFPQNFTIYDENDSAGCIRDAVRETLAAEGLIPANPETKDDKECIKKMLNKYNPRLMKEIFSLAKNNLIGPDEYRNMPELTEKDNHNGRPLTSRIFKRYADKCRTAGAMDFDDILFFMNDLLARDPYIRREIENRFRYILVDEYQDTNRAQYSIIRWLSKRNTNVAVVGDDSQSIYAFRGAKIENILNFKRDYENVAVFKLEQNYRSTKFIVNAANRLIANNGQRIPKTCEAVAGYGEPIRTEVLANERDEARYAAGLVATRHSFGELYSSFAVLYRTNAQSRALEDAFIKAKIPYVVYSGTSFFDRAEVKDAMAWFRLCVNPLDDEAFKRICNRPARGISDRTLDALSACAAAHGKPLSETIRNCNLANTGLKAPAIRSLGAFLETVDSLHSFTLTANASDAALKIFETSGIQAFYEKEDQEKNEDRAENIKEVINSIAAFIEEREEEYRLEHGGNEEGMESPSLLDYIESVSLISNADTPEEEGDRVSLMTAHCSKGLEFDNVIITGVEESLFPMTEGKAERSDDIEEERRLFYVAMTRARKRLTLTLCAERFKYGTRDAMDPSRFLAEIECPEEELALAEKEKQQEEADYERYLDSLADAMPEDGCEAVDEACFTA